MAVMMKTWMKSSTITLMDLDTGVEMLVPTSIVHTNVIKETSKRSNTMTKEQDILGSLREAEALELVEDTGDGWKTKVVPDELAQKAASEIIQLRQQVNELRSQLDKKNICSCATK